MIKLFERRLTFWTPVIESEGSNNCSHTICGLWKSLPLEALHSASQKLSFVVMVLADFRQKYGYRFIAINALLTPDKVG